jgi:hypothetical protein
MHQRRQGPAPGHRRADQREPGGFGARALPVTGDDRGERARLQPGRDHQAERAVAADPAVAHDGEPLRAVGRAPESVERVGEAVLMQRAGDDGADAERQQGRRQRRQPQRMAERQRRPRDQPDREADQRKGPARAGERAGVRRRAGGDRQPRQEGERAQEIAQRRPEGAGREGRLALLPLARHGLSL